MAGCEEVHHVASPIPHVQPEDPDELIVPAREGVLRVLGAARRGRPAGRTYLVVCRHRLHAEARRRVQRRRLDRPRHARLGALPRSKMVAERAAWDLMDRDGGDTELVAVNPTFLLGPTLTTDCAPRHG